MRHLPAHHVSPIALMQRHLYGFGALGASPVVQAGISTAKGAASGASVGGAVVGATSALAGAAAGAAAGSVVPIIGTAIGAIAGLIASGVFNKQDPEQHNFDQAVAMWQQNPDAVYNIGNKYLPLAGLFDLNIRTNIPIYKRYGHMGEQRFVTDMVQQIYQAAQSGKITASDTPLTIMARVVQPWIDSWGFGAMADPHADLINRLLIGMIADYVAGAQTNWKAVGGDYPFGSLPKFALPAAVVATTSPMPVNAPQQATGSTALIQNPNINLPGTLPTTSIQTFSNDGATITAGLNGLNVVLLDNKGNQYQLGPLTAGLALLYVNGTSIGRSVYQVTLSNGVALVKPSSGSTAVPYLSVAPAPAPASSNAVVPTPAVGNPPAPVPLPAPLQTTVPIPQGYTAVATDQTTGLPVYQGVNGTLYGWTGTTMTPYSGTVGTSSGPVNIANGVPLAQGSMSPMPLTQASYSAPMTAPSAPAPSPVSPVAAGVDTSALPPWLTWGAIAAGVALLFATARPLRGGHYSESSRAH